MSHRPEHMPRGVAWIGDACSIPSTDWIENLPDSTPKLSLRKGIAYLFIADSSTFAFTCVIKCICTPNLKLFSLKLGCRAQLLRESDTKLSSSSFTELPEQLILYTCSLYKHNLFVYNLFLWIREIFGRFIFQISCVPLSTCFAFSYTLVPCILLVTSKIVLGLGIAPNVWRCRNMY